MSKSKVIRLTEVTHALVSVPHLLIVPEGIRTGEVRATLMAALGQNVPMGGDFHSVNVYTVKGKLELAQLIRQVEDALRFGFPNCKVMRGTE